MIRLVHVQCAVESTDSVFHIPQIRQLRAGAHGHNEGAGLGGRRYIDGAAR